MTIEIAVESPQEKLNYSIVSSDSEENPLIIKLRCSTRSRKNTDVEDCEASLSTNTLENKATPKKRRRNKRGDIMDEEMPSPTKIIKPDQRPVRTPRHKDDHDVDSLCSSITNRVNIVTPVKTDCFENSEENDVSPTKRGGQTKTPAKDTPRSRRGSRQLDFNSPVKRDENEVILFGKRKSLAHTRDDEEYRPRRSVKGNLNESFRRVVLKSRHNLENIRRDSLAIQENKESSKVEDLSGDLRRSARKARPKDFFGMDHTLLELAVVLDDINLSPKKRVLRSRSSSIASSVSVESTSGSDLVMDLTPSKRNRLTKSRKKCEKSDNSEELNISPERRPLKQSVPKTPKTPGSRRKTIGTPKKAPDTPKTPKNRIKMIRDGVITPSMHSRSSILPGESTPLMKARSQLHVSYIPTSLPCREKEYEDVYNFLRGKLDDGCGGCMYISGVPGTGKTATVTSVIDSLLNDKSVSKFSFVSINGMRLTEPRQSYVEIWKQLTGKTVPWEQAQSLLEERFTKKKKHGPVVMLIDELDILCTKRQDVVYNLLDWPTKSKDQLIVITIANTMDLPERLLMSRVTSRLGLTRLTFQAYTHKQLMEIVTKRLMGTNSFNSDAVQLVARKVASVSGDARRALDICRRAAEIAEEEGKGQLVNIMHINEALNAMITQPQVTAIRRCSRLQKLLLQAIVAEIERTGVEETTFTDVLRILVSCCALDGFKMVSGTAAQRALSQLSACKLILTDQKCSDIYQRIILNVSVHDVYFALKKE